MLSFLCYSAFMDMNVKYMYALDHYRSSSKIVGLFMKWVIHSSYHLLGTSMSKALRHWGSHVILKQPFESLYSFCRAGTLSLFSRVVRVPHSQAGAKLGMCTLLFWQRPLASLVCTAVSIHECGCSLMFSKFVMSL